MKTTYVFIATLLSSSVAFAAQQQIEHEQQRMTADVFFGNLEFFAERLEKTAGAVSIITGNYDKQYYIGDRLSDLAKRMTGMITAMGALNAFKCANEEWFAELELLAAVDDQNSDAIKAALSKNVRPSMQVLGEPVFFRLVRCNALHLLHLFLDKGADINAQNADGETALLYCARAGRTEMVKALLEMGADTEIQDKDGRTALMYAGQPKTIELLLNTKASVNHQDKEGNSVLFLSARASLLNKVQLLLEHDADITLKNKNNESFEKYLGTCSSQTAEVQHIYLRCSEIYSEVRAAKAQLKITPNSNKNDSNNT